MELQKKDWILLILREGAMDRIHIMKTLFLLWHRMGRNVPNYFEFIPYLYGPCSFEVYSTLKTLESDGFIVQPPHPFPRWVNYYLTERGKREVEKVSIKAPSETFEIIKAVAKEVSKLNFYELLRKVYDEAPDFARNSIFKGVILK